MVDTRHDAHFWDRAARKYAEAPIKDMAGYERTLERTRGLLTSADNVLEIGCGTGSTALELAPSVGHVVGTDISGEMIAIAKEKAVARSCPNVTFAVSAAGRAPGDTMSYDAVLAFNVLHLVAERNAVLANVARLLKPGGLLICKTPCLSEMNPLIRLAVPVMRLFGKAPFVAFFSASQIEAEIAHAGFEIVLRERHGSGRKDPRIFLVARKPAHPDHKQ